MCNVMQFFFNKRNITTKERPKELLEYFPNLEILYYIQFITSIIQKI